LLAKVLLCAGSDSVEAGDFGRLRLHEILYNVTIYNIFY
jgi:hypothetical protein